MTISPKEAALQAIQQLPDDATYEDIMYELYFRDRVDRGLRDADEGQVMPHSQVMREAFDWLKSNTRPARA